MTQARAVCHVADREILTVNAALGDRPFDRAAQWETMPDRRRHRPSDCPAAIRMRRRRHDQQPAGPAPGARAARSTSWTARPATAGRCCGRACPRCSTGSTAPRWPCSATSCRWASARPSASGRRQQPRQHAAHRAARADRVGAARHPRARRRARVRPRPRAHVRRGRHAAGHRQPELHRALLASEPVDDQPVGDAGAGTLDTDGDASRRSVTGRDAACSSGMTVPLPGPLHTHREARRAGRPRLHRHLVGRGRRRRRLHAAGAGRGVGATAAPRHGDRARLHPGAGVLRAVRRHRWPTPRRAGSRSGSARRAT